MKGLLLMPCLAAARGGAGRRWRRQQQQQMPEPVAPEWTKDMPQTWEPAKRCATGAASRRRAPGAPTWTRSTPTARASAGAIAMTASMSAPFHTRARQTLRQGLRRHGFLDACVARCDGVYSGKCLRGALPARGAISGAPRRLRGALRARGERRAAGMCGDVGLK